MKRGYHHGNLRQALVEAALALIAEKGPQGFTLSEAAKAADVTPAAVYRHFAGRDDLLAEVARQGFDIFAALMEYAWSEGQPTALAALRGDGPRLSGLRPQISRPLSGDVRKRAATSQPPRPGAGSAAAPAPPWTAPPAADRGPAVGQTPPRLDGLGPCPGAVAWGGGIVSARQWRRHRPSRPKICWNPPSASICAALACSGRSLSPASYGGRCPRKRSPEYCPREQLNGPSPIALGKYSRRRRRL